MHGFEYIMDDGQLVIRDTSLGKTVWRGGFGAPVVQIITSTNLDGCLVLLDSAAQPKPTFENLLKVDPDGSVRWKAQLPGAHDSFTQIIDHGTRVEAQTWNGQMVEIDLTTGHTKNVRFVK